PRLPPRSTLFPYTTLFRSLLTSRTLAVLDQESHVLSERLEHRRHVRERRPGVVGEASLAQQGLSPSENLTLSPDAGGRRRLNPRDRKSTRLNSSHVEISYA